MRCRLWGAVNVLENLLGSFLSDLRVLSGRAIAFLRWQSNIPAKLEIQANMINIAKLLTNEIKGL